MGMNSSDVVFPFLQLLESDKFAFARYFVNGEWMAKDDRCSSPGFIQSIEESCKSRIRVVIQYHDTGAAVFAPRAMKIHELIGVGASSRVYSMADPSSPTPMDRKDLVVKIQPKKNTSGPGKSQIIVSDEFEIMRKCWSKSKKSFVMPVCYFETDLQVPGMNDVRFCFIVMERLRLGIGSIARKTSYQGEDGDTTRLSRNDSWLCCLMVASRILGAALEAKAIGILPFDIHHGNVMFRLRKEERHQNGREFKYTKSELVLIDTGRFQYERKVSPRSKESGIKHLYQRIELFDSLKKSLLFQCRLAKIEGDDRHTGDSFFLKGEDSKKWTDFIEQVMPTPKNITSLDVNAVRDAKIRIDIEADRVYQMKLSGTDGWKPYKKVPPGTKVGDASFPWDEFFV